MSETYTPRHPATASQVTLATRTLDGQDVLILTHGSVIEFYPTEDVFLTPAAVEAYMAIAFMHQLAKEAPAPPPPAPPVKPKTLPWWLRMLAPRTPHKSTEIKSQQVRG